MVAEEEIFNDLQTNGIIGPHSKMLGPVADGGRIKNGKSSRIPFLTFPKFFKVASN